MSDQKRSAAHIGRMLRNASGLKRSDGQERSFELLDVWIG